jgi:hypothetical protein
MRFRGYRISSPRRCVDRWPGLIVMLERLEYGPEQLSVGAMRRARGAADELDAS